MVERWEAILVAIVGIVGWGIVYALSVGAMRVPQAEVASPAKHADGCPIDAIAYDAPAFADGGTAYMVEDRASGERWWMVRMGGEWVVLPLDNEGGTADVG